MNPIEKKLREIAPGYNPTEKQRDQIARADDPQTVADRLEGRVQDMREDVAREGGFDAALVPADLLLPVLDLSRALKGYGGDAALSKISRAIGGEKILLAVGRAVGQQEAGTPDNAPTPKPDALTCIYREVLGREPDSEGLAFWRGHYQDGMPLSEVIRHVEDSDEAQG